MGSFNVACGISNISMGWGTRCGLVILKPNQYEKGPHLVGRDTNLIYSNCYFNPFSLPIFGTYDDYGGLKNIERTKNVEILEEYFCMKIEDIIDIVTSGRGNSISDSFSSLVEKFGVLKGFSYSDEFSDKWLETLKFEKRDDKWYHTIKPYVAIITSIMNGNRQDWGFELYKIVDGVEILLKKIEPRYGTDNEFFNVFEEEGYLININFENVERIERTFWYVFS